MLKVECEIEDDYKLRCSRVVGSLVEKPDPNNGKPLVVRDRDGLVELSFLYFARWLITSILNQSKVRYSLGLVPVGPNGESSLLVLYRKNILPIRMTRFSFPLAISLRNRFVSRVTSGLPWPRTS